jgi:hypothetical protein
MAKSKKKSSRMSFVFKDTTFYEDPCRKTTILRAYAGGKGKDGPLSKCIVIMGPAAFVGHIKDALRNAG